MFINMSIPNFYVQWDYNTVLKTLDSMYLR